MSVAHLLEDFESRAQAEPLEITDVALEEQKLDAFEAGYQAGWDDSAENAKTAGHLISEELSKAVHDLSFTYQEAYGNILRDIEPILTQLVNAVLPELAQATLGAQVLELIKAEFATQGPLAVEITAAPENVAPLRHALGMADHSAPVSVTPDHGLASGQVHLRFGDEREHELNIDAVNSGIQQAVRGFFQQYEYATQEKA